MSQFLGKASGNGHLPQISCHFPLFGICISVLISRKGIWKWLFISRYPAASLSLDSSNYQRTLWEGHLIRLAFVQASCLLPSLLIHWITNGLYGKGTWWNWLLFRPPASFPLSFHVLSSSLLIGERHLENGCSIFPGLLPLSLSSGSLGKASGRSGCLSYPDLLPLSLLWVVPKMHTKKTPYYKKEIVGGRPTVIPLIFHPVLNFFFFFFNTRSAIKGKNH